MDRSVVTVAELTAYNTSGAVTADAVDVTNNHSIDVSDINDGKLLIIFTGGTAEYTATFKAGDFSDADIGDLAAITVGTTATIAIVVESSRFKDSDGLILIDAASSGSPTGTILAVKLP